MACNFAQECFANFPSNDLLHMSTHGYGHMTFTEAVFCFPFSCTDFNLDSFLGLFYIVLTLEGYFVVTGIAVRKTTRDPQGHNMAFADLQAFGCSTEKILNKYDLLAIVTHTYLKSTLPDYH